MGRYIPGFEQVHIGKDVQSDNGHDGEDQHDGGASAQDDAENAVDLCDKGELLGGDRVVVGLQRVDILAHIRDFLLGVLVAFRHDVCDSARILLGFFWHGANSTNEKLAFPLK